MWAVQIKRNVIVGAGREEGLRVCRRPPHCPVERSYTVRRINTTDASARAHAVGLHPDDSAGEDALSQSWLDPRIEPLWEVVLLDNTVLRGEDEKRLSVFGQEEALT